MCVRRKLQSATPQCVKGFNRVARGRGWCAFKKTIYILLKTETSREDFLFCLQPLFFLIFGATQWQHDVRQLTVCGYNSAVNITNIKLTMFRHWSHFVKKCTLSVHHNIGNNHIKNMITLNESSKIVCTFLCYHQLH